MKKKFASLFLVMALVVTMIPSMAFAATAGTVTTDKDSYELGEPIMVTATTTAEGAYVGLYDNGRTDASAAWYYVNDDAHTSGSTYNIVVDYDTDEGGWNHEPVAGEAKVVLKDGAGTELASKTITLTESNAAKSVDVDAATCYTNTKIKVMPVSSGVTDWVAIYKGDYSGTTNFNGMEYYGDWAYTYGASGASITLSYLSAGTYTVALLEDGGYTAADTQVFTVADKGLPAATLTTDKTTYAFGDPIKVTTDFENTDAWVGIYKKGEVPSSTVKAIAWYTISAAGQTGTINDTAWLDSLTVLYAGHDTRPGEWTGGKLKCGDYDVKVFKDYGYTPVASKTITISHTWTAAGTTAATCTAAATSTSKCTVCGLTETKTTGNATGHKPGAAATCTTAQKCTACGTTLAAAKGHTPGAAATCTTAQKCTTCGTTLAAAKGHTPGAAATCTAAQKCTSCGTVLAAAKGHTPGAAATCTADQTCTSCGTVLAAAKGHTPGAATTVKATAKKDGSVTTACTTCGEVLSKEVIKKASKVSLSVASYAYNGKVKSPKVVVKDSAGKTIAKANYKVTTPKGRKNVGTYTYTIKFKGDKYSGTKKVTLTIKPAKPTIKAPKAAKKAITAKWKKVAKQTTGYEVLVATNKNFTKNKKSTLVKSYKKTSVKVTKLKAKTKYFVKVRAYKTVKGKKIYSDWSKVKTIKTK